LPEEGGGFLPTEHGDASTAGSAPPIDKAWVEPTDPEGRERMGKLEMLTLEDCAIGAAPITPLGPVAVHA
jgi:hypothetical protein